MKVNELLQSIEGSYKKYFPESRCCAELNTNLYKSISVRCLLSKDNTEVANGIWQNDILSIAFMIDAAGGELEKDIDLDSELPSIIQIKVLDNSYVIKPDNQYMCYSRRKLSYRKTKGDANKIIKTFDKWFKKLHEELEKDIESNTIHDNHMQLLKSKML